MRGTRQVTKVFAFGFGFIVPLSKTICCFAIMLTAMAALIIKFVLINQLKLTIEFQNYKSCNNKKISLLQNLRGIFESWILFFASKVNIPGQGYTLH